jgi:hypothetical protein
MRKRKNSEIHRRSVETALAGWFILSLGTIMDPYSAYLAETKLDSAPSSLPSSSSPPSRTSSSSVVESSLLSPDLDLYDLRCLSQVTPVYRSDIGLHETEELKLPDSQDWNEKFQQM